MFLIGENWIDEKDCPISPIDRGLTLGDGVFDTMLIENSKAKHQEEHLERILKHAAVLEIKNLPSLAQLKSRAERLITQEISNNNRYTLRTTITRGQGMRGLAPPPSEAPMVIMRLAEIPNDMPPAKAWIAESTRRNEFSPLSRIKSINYADNILALLEARKHDHNEAILLNTKNNVCCSSSGNIYIVENNEIITPPLTDGVMDGVTRSHLIKAHSIKEQIISKERFLEAEEIYISNAISIRPVILLNNKQKTPKQRLSLI